MDVNGRRKSGDAQYLQQSRIEQPGHVGVLPTLSKAVSVEHALAKRAPEQDPSQPSPRSIVPLSQMPRPAASLPEIARDWRGRTALHEAAESADLNKLELLLTDQPWLVHERSNDGATALHVAAVEGHAGIVETLARHAPDLIDAAKRNGDTPLIAAVWFASPEAARVLIGLGANPALQGRYGKTALHHAAISGDAGLAGVMLARDPSCVNIADGSGQTALFLAVKYENLSVVKLLVAAGADASLRPADSTPLIEAALKGDAPLVDALLSSGSVDLFAQRPSNGAGALFYAAAHGHTHIVKSLLKASDNPRALAWSADRWGATALSVAAENGHLEAVRELRLAMGPPAALRSVRTAIPTNRCWVVRGNSTAEQESELRVMASRGERELDMRFAGDDHGISWQALVELVNNNRVAGSRWLIDAHGLEWQRSEPRHGLMLSDQDTVPTSEVIKLLAQNGVNRVDIWACQVHQAAKHMALRLEQDLSWPIGTGDLRVTFHAANPVNNLASLTRTSVENAVLDFASPGTPSRCDRMDLYGSVEVLFNQTTRKVTIKPRAAASTVEDVALRLDGLNIHDKRRLIGDFMQICCDSGNAVELARVFERFGELASPNYQGEYQTPLLHTALSRNREEVVHLLLEKNALLSHRHTLRMAARHSSPAVVAKLLEHKEVWRYRRQALEEAEERGLAACAEVIGRHLAAHPFDSGE